MTTRRSQEHAKAAFGALVRTVELSAEAGVIAATDPVEAAQQVWSAVHGAVALELKGLILSADPAATYRALLGNHHPAAWRPVKTEIKIGEHPERAVVFSPPPS